jgi:hypothetical protein
VIFGKEGGLCQGTQAEALLPREACTGFRREPGKVASNGYNAAQAVWRPIQPGIPVESIAMAESCFSMHSLRMKIIVK